MIICGMEKYSMVDYPDKIACTIFTLSCNFRCPFCHNSGLVIPGMSNVIIDEKEVLAYLEKRKRMLDAVCITGGEPTLQKDLKQFIIKVKEIGLLVKLDSNGSNPAILKELINENLLDYIAMDIKNSPDAYADIIGVANYNTNNVRESVETIKNSNVSYEFRTTLVNEYHNEERIKEIGKWLKGAKNYYLQCFEDKGSNIKSGLSGIQKDKAERFVEILKENIFNVRLRNYD